MYLAVGGGVDEALAIHDLWHLHATQLMISDNIRSLLSRS